VIIFKFELVGTRVEIEIRFRVRSFLFRREKYSK